jgi:flagellin-like protein
MYNKKAVSAIIGVILMVAITVAIAATVYVYVESLRSHSEEEIVFTVEGWVISASSTEHNIMIDEQNYTIWRVYIGDNYDTSLKDSLLCNMIFTNNMSAPPDNVKLRLSYMPINHDLYNVVFNVYKVKSL